MDRHGLAPGHRLGRRPPLDLTAAEFALLGALVRDAGSVMATLRLADIIRRLPDAASPCQIRLCLAHLRAKIGPGPRGGSPIVTLPGYGYRYIAPVIRG